MRTLVVLGAVFEAAMIAAAVGYLLLHRARRRNGPMAGTPTRRGKRRESFSSLHGVEDRLGAWLPDPAPRLILLEPRMWWCLYRWLARRRPAAEDPFSYHRRSPLGAVVLVVLFTTPVELLLFELLIPVLWIRIVLLVSAVYAVFWLVAYRAATIVLPHGVTDEGVFVRYGLSAEVRIPFDHIVDVRLERSEGARGSLGIPREGASVEAGEAAFIVGGHSDLTLELDADLPVLFLLKDRGARVVRVAVDEPEKMSDAVLRGIERTKDRSVEVQAPGVTPTESEADASSSR